MREITKIITGLMFLGIIYFPGVIANASAPILEIDFKNMNGHAVVKMDEGFKDVIKLNVKNAKGDLTYTINGGSDKDSFEFDSKLNLLKFKNEPDFENPADIDLNNIYRVAVIIKDSEVEMTQSFWVHINDVEYFKKETKKEVVGGIRGKRNTEVCKDTRALNFESRGRHNENLCLYPVKEEVKNKISQNYLEDNKEKKEEGKVSTMAKKPVIKKNLSKKLVSKKKANLVIAKVTNKNNKIENENKVDSQVLVDAKIAEKDENKKSIQTASILDSKMSSKSGGSNPWAFWIFAFLVLTAAWLVWKIFKKEENIDNL